MYNRRYGRYGHETEPAKIAVGDLGEFWYGDYKEPFEQLEGGVPGHPVGVVLKADDGKLLCAFCGKTYDNLGRHVATHGLNGHDYKAEVGLLQKSALVSETTRLGRVRSALAHAQTFAVSRERQATPGRYGHFKGRANSEWTPERLNKTGRCYAQLLATARSIQTGGHLITMKSLGRHGIGEATVRAYFPDGLPALRAAVGAKATLRKRGWTDRQLLDAFKALAETIGRTPRESDIKRYGLPDPTTYTRRFGTLTAVSERVGLPPNLPVPMEGAREVAILNAYSVLGDVNKVAARFHTSPKGVLALFALYGCPFPSHGTPETRRFRREWAADMARRLAGTDDVAA